MARALDVHKRESMALEKDAFYYLDMNLRSVGKSFTSISERGFFPEPQDIT